MSGYDRTDDMVTCPYDPVHKVKRNHMFKHLSKCSKNFPNVKLEICPFNSLHRFKKELEELHLLECPDRVTFESYLVESSTYEKISIQTIVDKAPPSEVWDNDSDCPSYDPKKKLEQSLIPRTLRCATKAEKRKFREEEDERCKKLRRIMKEGGSDDAIKREPSMEREKLVKFADPRLNRASVSSTATNTSSKSLLKPKNEIVDDQTSETTKTATQQRLVAPEPIADTAATTTTAARKPLTKKEPDTNESQNSDVIQETNTENGGNGTDFEPPVFLTPKTEPVDLNEASNKF